MRNLKKIATPTTLRQQLNEIANQILNNLEITLKHNRINDL
ncbi:MAG: hypothetical protein ACI8RD_008967 [Bacillariaceae sp.]|jgi:hypothetical protein